MTSVNSADLAGATGVTPLWQDLVIAPADDDHGLEGVTRSLALAEDTRRVFGLSDLPRLKAALTKRRKAYERSGTNIATALLVAERAVRETEDDVRAASHRVAELTANMETLQGRLSDVQLATAALIAAGEGARLAQARLDEANGARARWEEERPEMMRLVVDFETRLARHGDTQHSDEDGAPWCEADLERRRGSAIEASNRANAVQTEALSILEQSRRESDAAGEDLRRLIAKIDEFRLELQSVPCPRDDPVRAALDEYEASCAPGRFDRDACCLADRWAGLERRRDALLGSQPPMPSPETLDAARRRVDDAIARTRDAELMVQNPFTPTERAELDRAHRVVSAGERSLRRWVPGQAKRREHAQLRLNSLLGQHGFTDFLDYRIRHSQGDGDWASALDEARRELEEARAAARALEEACAPSPELRALEQEGSEVRQAAGELLGFHPGVGIEQLLRSKPQVSGDVTRCLAEALRDVNVKLGDCSLDAAAHGWLAACDTQRRVRAAAEKRLAVVDQQIAAIQGFGALDPSLSLLEDSLQMVAMCAADRGRHANRLQELLDQELDARQEATAQGQRDTEDAAVLSAHLEALRRHLEHTDQQIDHNTSVAADDLNDAIAEKERATDVLDTSGGDLALLLSSDRTLDSVLSAALVELNELLVSSETVRGDLAAAMALRQRTYTELADVRQDLVRHRAAAPPMLPDLPGLLDVVAALQWLARSEERAERPLCIYVRPERAEELPAGAIRDLLDLSHRHWVVCTSEAPDGDVGDTPGDPALASLPADASSSDIERSATPHPRLRRLRRLWRTKR
jgi:hypothetical protein